MIEYGNERGLINPDNIMKVHYMNESFWIKVLALNNKKTKVIGLLMNSLLDNEIMTWGTMVLAEEVNVKELCEVQYVVDSIPNNEEWSII